MAVRVICVKAPRGLRGLLRLFAKERKTVSVQPPEAETAGGRNGE